MKKILTLLLIIYYLLLVPEALAISPTPSTSAEASPAVKASPEATKTATPTTDKDAKIKERVQERIEGIKNRVFEQAFWGTLVDVNNSTLIAKTSKGERIIKTNEDTKIIDASKKTIKISDLEIGNFLIVNGVTEQETFTAKRVVVLKTTPKAKPSREVAHGAITKITEKQKLLTVTNEKKNISYKVLVNDKTTISKKVEDKNQKVAFADLTEGDVIVAIGIKDADTEIITAKILHVIPGKSTPRKVSPTPSVKTSPTPSEKLSPTPTVKISPTPTPTKKPSPTPTATE